MKAEQKEKLELPVACLCCTSNHSSAHTNTLMMDTVMNFSALPSMEGLMPHPLRVL